MLPPLATRSVPGYHPLIPRAPSDPLHSRLAEPKDTTSTVGNIRYLCPTPGHLVAQPDALITVAQSTTTYSTFSPPQRRYKLSVPLPPPCECDTCHFTIHRINGLLHIALFGSSRNLPTPRPPNSFLRQGWWHRNPLVAPPMLLHQLPPRAF